MRDRNASARLALIVGGISAVLYATGASSLASSPELQRSTRQQISRVYDAMERPNERRCQSAIELMDGVLSDEALPSFDRSVVYEVRGQLRYMCNRDPSALADDGLQALAYDLGYPRRGPVLVDYVGDALLAAGRLDDALAFADLHADQFFGGPSASIVYKAEVYLMRGQLDAALWEVGAENDPADPQDLRKMRCVLLLVASRDAEADICLIGLYESTILPQVIDAEREAIADLRIAGATAAERREYGLGFLARVDAQEAQFLPTQRVNPTGFERCLRGGSGGRGQLEQVAFRFDVNEEGRVENVVVLDSTDACFEPYSAKAVEQWVYDPRVVNGEAVRTLGVETTIRYEIR
ncbi:MAG: energy transducer TonB [Pseudomonadota bacterium]